VTPTIDRTVLVSGEHRAWDGRGILFKRPVAMHFGAAAGSVLDEIGQAASSALHRTGVTTRR
jgi:hypothetical protein